MSRQLPELRSWAFITISFLVGMVVAEVVDLQFRADDDHPTAVVDSHRMPDPQP